MLQVGPAEPVAAEQQECSCCKKSRPLTEFQFRYPGERRKKCRHCRRPQHRLSNRARTRRQKLVARDVIDKAKNVPCTDCGKEYPPYVMDFDHNGTDEKYAGISELSRFTRNTLVILAEIAKCQVVCANCHRERTHQRILLAKTKIGNAE